MNVLKLLLFGCSMFNKSLCANKDIKFHKLYNFWGSDALMWQVPTPNPGEKYSKRRHDSPQIIYLNYSESKYLLPKSVYCYSW